MDTIINYFKTIPPSDSMLILVCGLTAFWFIENAAPFYQMRYNKWKHAGTNLFFTFTTIVVNVIMAFMLVKSAEWTQETHFGILNWLPTMPSWLYVLIGMLLLDLIGGYLVHWIQHKVKWMWRFHLIHHTDLNVDVTSANRNHPGESVFRVIFTVLGALIAGAPMWLILMYQASSVFLSQFNHANFGLPKWLENPLSWIFITPDVHRVHHHYVQPYTDSNYGNIFVIWDRLFGTYMSLDRDKLVYGIDTHMNPQENDNISPLLKIPFK